MEILNSAICQSNFVLYSWWQFGRCFCTVFHE